MRPRFPRDRERGSSAQCRLQAKEDGQPNRPRWSRQWRGGLAVEGGALRCRLRPVSRPRELPSSPRTRTGNNPALRGIGQQRRGFLHQPGPPHRPHPIREPRIGRGLLEILKRSALRRPTWSGVGEPKGCPAAGVGLDKPWRLRTMGGKRGRFTTGSSRPSAAGQPASLALTRPVIASTFRP